MRYGAFGLVEVVGSANAILVVDRMLKAADVRYETWHTRCGGVAAVKAAVESVQGNPPCEIVAAAVISSPSEETARIVEEWAGKAEA